MGQHRLPAIANRLRINRGFNSAWYSDFHYAQLLQKDWLLTRSAQSLVQRSSRSRPRQRLTLSQQLQLLEALRAARAEGRDLDVQAAAAQAIAASTSGQAQGLSMCDYPNLRVGRIFTQHLPYKSIVSTFAYSVPEQGPQNKYVCSMMLNFVCEQPPKGIAGDIYKTTCHSHTSSEGAATLLALLLYQ
eukprot:231481-Pelagomonas_calceolata.AAC.1